MATTITDKRTTAKKPAAKTRTATRKTRTRRAPAQTVPLNGIHRELASQILGYADERALVQDKLGVVSTRNRELKGRRSGTSTVIAFDDDTRMTITVAVRKRAARGSKYDRPVGDQDERCRTYRSVGTPNSTDASVA